MVDQVLRRLKISKEKLRNYLLEIMKEKWHCLFVQTKVDFNNKYREGILICFQDGKWLKKQVLSTLDYYFLETVRVENIFNINEICDNIRKMIGQSFILLSEKSSLELLN